MKKAVFTIVAVSVFGIGLFMIANNKQNTNTTPEKISVVATLFPQYDFAKAIGGDKVEATLLLPPGVEAHAYEPKPSDITKINEADIFVYTGEFMEPWAHDIIESADRKSKVVDASTGANLTIDDEGHEEEEATDHQESGVDPHIWLDFDNAKIMASNITKTLIEIDSQNTDYYQKNLQELENKLLNLDNAYKKTLSACNTKSIVYGGHYAFGYMAKRYNLDYVAAQGFSPDAEPSAKDMIALTEQIKKSNIDYIFYEELGSPKIAETLARETDTKLLLLNGAHNITREDFESNKTFLTFMENNLDNLSLGLGCKQ